MTMTKNSGGFRFRDPKDRDPYLDVCEATRIALDRAAEQSLTGGDLRIILAVVHLLTARSRMWDYTSHKQIAEIAKVHRRRDRKSVV